MKKIYLGGIENNLLGGGLSKHICIICTSHTLKKIGVPFFKYMAFHAKNTKSLFKKTCQNNSALQ